MSITTFCRLCASKGSNFVNIYEEGKKIKLAWKITQCLQIWLFPEDVLPKTVCTACCEKLDQYSSFFDVCSEAQNYLMSVFCERKQHTGEFDTIMKEGFTIAPADEIENASIGCEQRETVYSDLDADDSKLEIHSVLSLGSCTSKREPGSPKERDVSSEELTRMPSKKTTSSSKPAPKTKSQRNCSMKKRKKTTKKKQDSCPSVVDKGKKEQNTNHVNVSSDIKDYASDVHNDDFIDDEIKDEEENEDDLLDQNDDDMKSLSPNKRVSEWSSWQCTDCPAKLTTLSALKDHHRTEHKQAPNFMCSYCTKVYTRYRSFARHVKLHGNPKKFSCEVCGKSFSQKTVLQSHSTVHSEDRPHVCVQCGKAFKQFSSLYLHSKCHLPEQIKPKFPCTVCPKQFSTKHTLETHMKIHTGERNFVCDICGKSFVAKGSLDYHILTHTDTKPHSCLVCGKGFKTIRLLTKHSTLHTGIKPHQCDVCGKQFRERGALKEHNRIHTGAMPYSCEFCGKLFRFKGILTVHRRQHTGERPYGCTECRREFTNWANYNKHMKRRHRTVATEHQDTGRNQFSRGSNNLQHQPTQHPPPPDLLPVRQSHSPQELAQQQSLMQPQQPSLASPPPQSQQQPQSQPHSSQPQIITVTPLSSVPTNIQHQMQSPIYTDATADGYKILHEEAILPDIYRVPPYVPHTMTSMGYYLPSIHQPVLHTRNQ